jgi:hypothetical protein
MSTKKRLNSYNPDWDVSWNLIPEEIPGHRSQQCREKENHTYPSPGRETEQFLEFSLRNRCDTTGVQCA